MMSAGLSGQVDSPDLLSEQCVSAYLMREGANEKSSPQLTQISRVRLPRAAKSSQGKQRQVIDMRSVRGGRTRGSGSRGRGRCQSEQIIDDEKHNRAMDVLYHLQQRQEQVLAILDDNLPPDEINVEGMETEISAIEEALSRLTRIFKLAKDELNSSQCFPNATMEETSARRKQLQMNTRLTKCTALSKTQSSLLVKFAQFRDTVNDMVSASMMTDSIAVTDESSVLENSQQESEQCGIIESHCDRELADTSMDSTEEIDIHAGGADQSSLFPSPTTPSKPIDKIPFSQECYNTSDNLPKSQSQAQSILDEIFSETSYAFSQEDHEVTSQQEKLSQGSVVAWFNDKLFVSPPRKPLRAVQNNISGHNQRKRSHSDSVLSEDMNTTGVFEPSQSPALSTQFSQPLFSISHLDRRGKAKLGNPLATSTQLPLELLSGVQKNITLSAQSKLTQEETMFHGGCSSTSSLLSNEARLQPPKKFTLNSDMRVAVHSNTELREWPSDLLPANIWDKPGCEHFSLPQKLIDMIDKWD